VHVHDRAVRAVRWWRRLAKAHGTRSDERLFHAVRNGPAPLTQQAAAGVTEVAHAAALPHLAYRPSRLEDPSRLSPVGSRGKLS
jgi:hypothetical protein